MSTRYVPSAPWTLACPWCDWRAIVNARGARGNDQGAGVEAAEVARRHAEIAHGKTWPEFLAVRASSGGAAVNEPEQT